MLGLAFSNRTSIITQDIIYPEGTDLNAVADNLYARIRNFDGFSESTNYHIQNWEFGDSRGVIFGQDGGPVTSPVILTDRDWARTLTADTTYPHFLQGTRQWSVYPSGSNTISLRTAAIDKFADPYQAAVISTFTDFLHGGQHSIWTDWFDALADSQVKEFNAKIGEQKINEVKCNE